VVRGDKSEAKLGEFNRGGDPREMGNIRRGEALGEQIRNACQWVKFFSQGLKE